MSDDAELKAELGRLRAAQAESQQRYEQKYNELIERWRTQNETINRLMTSLGVVYSWVHELPVKDGKQVEWLCEARKLLGRHDQ